MKILKKILLILLAIVVLIGVAIFIFIRTFDANRYKDRLAKEISEVLNRPVTIGRVDLGVSLTTGATLEVKKMDIEGLMSIRSTYLHINIKEYMGKKEIIIPKIVLESPSIQIVQSELASINESLEEIKSKTNKTSSKKENTTNQASDLNLKIDQIKITDGTIIYRDDLNSNEREIKLTNVTLSVSNISLKESKLGHINSGTLSFTVDPTVLHKGASAPINVNLIFSMNESIIYLDKMDIKIAEGSLNGKGHLKDVLETPGYAFDLKMESVSLLEILNQQGYPFEIQGLLYGDATVAGKGFDQHSLTNNQTGKANLFLYDGKLVDFNLLNFAMEKLSAFPELVDNLKYHLSKSDEEKLQQKDTTINKAYLNARLEAGYIALNSITLDADGLIYEASGNIDFNQNLDLESSFYFSEDLSTSMINTEEGLSALLDEKNQIRIPFKQYQGKIENFKPVPNIGDLIMQGLQNRGEEELKKALRKALDFDDEVVTEGQMGEDADLDEVIPAEQQANPEEILIESIIDILPVFK